MKTLKTFFLVLFLACTLVAQSNVDRLIRRLDSLSLSSFNDWKVSPDLKSYKPQGDPTQAGFNDTGWQSLKLNENIYPDSCWIRKEIAVPERILGKPVSGMLKLLVSVDDYGYLWINSESKGHFPWNGEFELTKNAKPGERFLIAIKAVNTGGPLRLIRAEVASEELKPLRTLIEDFSLSLRVGQKLLGFDTYQTSSSKRVDPGTDKSAMDRAEKARLSALLQSIAANVDVRPLSDGPLDRFESMLADVREQLKPIDNYAKRFTLYFNSNAHIDAAWLWREQETIEVCKNTFASVLNMFDARPDFTYTQSAAAYYDWMERLYPDLFKKIQQRVKDGRWEVVGGMWVEPDCNLPSGESWARHLLYGKRYFREKLGVEVKIGWNPDSFGYTWNMPQFYRNAGIDAFITQKIGWNDTNVFPHRLFWWESPDGSRVLSYFPFDYVNEISNGYQLVDWLRQFEANTGFTKMMVLFGVGDHGGGPSLEMMARIDRLRKLDVFPTVEFGNPSGYLNWIKGHDLDKLPVVTDELYLEYHQGTYTTQATMKKFNRTSEVLLTNAEKLSSLAAISGGAYDASSLEDAWKKVLFNQFHDILPGSSIREVYIDATESHQDAQGIAQVVLKRSLNHLARQVNTTKIQKGTPVIVFNALSWTRTDLVRLDLPREDLETYSVFTSDGKEIPSQLVRTGRFQQQIIFVAEGVPPIGYKMYELRKQSPTLKASKLATSGRSIENHSFRVEIDPVSGWVKSVFDKRNGREVLKGNGNELQLLADYPRAWDAWNIGLTGEQYPSKLRRVDVIETGPVRGVLRLQREYLKPGTKKDFPTEDFPSTFFTQDIILYDGIDRIDFKTDVDWWEEKTMLKVAFPLAVSDTAATYEIPYGTIRRSTQLRDSWDRAKVEVPAYRWADLSQSDYGVSLLNNSKYGHDIKGNTIRLSLLRSPKWPDPTADRGKHTIEYALYPHKGSWKEGMTVRRAAEYNNPLLCILTDTHKGSLAGSRSFVSLSPSNLMLTTIKKAEDSDAWILQWYETEGTDTEARLVLPKTVRRVVLSNFLEEDGRMVESSGTEVRITTKKNSITTVKVSF